MATNPASAEIHMNDDTALEQIRHGQCCRKIQFESTSSAEANLARLREHLGKPDLKMRVYYCVFCNGFHLGGKQKISARQLMKDLGRLLRFGFDEPCSICGGRISKKERRRRAQAAASAGLSAEICGPARATEPQSQRQSTLTVPDSAPSVVVG